MRSQFLRTIHAQIAYACRSSPSQASEAFARVCVLFLITSEACAHLTYVPTFYCTVNITPRMIGADMHLIAMGCSLCEVLSVLVISNL